MRKGLIYSIISALLILGCATQDNNGYRGFDKEEIAEYNSSNRFNYDRKIVVRQNVLLEFFIKVITAIGRLLHSVLGITLTIILVALLIWLIIANVKRDRPTPVDEDIGFRKIDESTVESIDFDALIKKALEKQDYRMAIRYRFLNLLKQLSKHKLISIKEGKTNFEYYHELPSMLKAPYQSVLRLFEYVWYGHFPSDKVAYEKMEEGSKNLIGLTKTKNA
ncbi:MAG: DUF4129 domain-containing protein [Bacteroidota bacterium]